MSLRLDYFSLAPQALEILMQQERYLQQQFVNSNTLTIALWELIKLRVSQMNQCAFCIDMHSKDALSRGESITRIVGLNAWRDTPLYSQVELTALEVAEQLTLSQTLDDDYFYKVQQVLSDEDIVNLTVAINAINSWNRIAKTFKPEVGSYKPQ